MPAELERIVTKALSKDPASRYASAQDLERELFALGIVGSVSGGYPPVRGSGARPAGAQAPAVSAAEVTQPLLRGGSLMPGLLRNVLAVVAGFIAGGLVNMTIISLSPSLIPPPAGVDVSSADASCGRSRRSAGSTST